MGKKLFGLVTAEDLSTGNFGEIIIGDNMAFTSEGLEYIISVNYAYGETFPPTSAITGRLFYRTDLQTLFSYGTAWKAIYSFGNTTLYVDGASGSDAVGQGYGSGANATATIQYAIDLIPPINDGNVVVNIAAGTYAETVNIQGKTFTGDYTLTINGALTSLEAVTSATCSAGSGSTQGTVTKTGQFTGDSYANKLVKFETDGDYRLMDSHTDDVLTLVGTYSGVTATQNVTIYDWATSVTAINIKTNQTVYIYNILCPSIVSSAFSNTFIERCCGSAYRVDNGIVSITTCFFTGGAVIVTCFSFGQIFRTKITSAPSYSVYVNTYSFCGIYRGTIINGSITGVLIGTASVANFDTSAAQGFMRITNNTTGILCNTATSLISFAQNNYYSGNTTNLKINVQLTNNSGTVRYPYHITEGSVALSSGTATVTLTIPASFASATNYTVVVTPPSTGNNYAVVNNSGTSFTITSSNGSDSAIIRYIAIGD